MGDSKYWQTREGPPKALQVYLRRTSNRMYREEAEEARVAALARGVPERPLQEKCAELLREREEDQRRIDAKATRSRLQAQLIRVARTIRRLPRDEQDEPVIGAFMDLGRQMFAYLDGRQEKDVRKRRRRPVSYFKKAIADFRSYGLRAATRRMPSRAA